MDTDATATAVTALMVLMVVIAVAEVEAGMEIVMAADAMMTAVTMMPIPPLTPPPPPSGHPGTLDDVRARGGARTRTGPTDAEETAARAAGSIAATHNTEGKQMVAGMAPRENHILGYMTI